MPKHVFLSYARNDGQKFAIQLHDDLEKEGIEVWIDIHDIRPGEDWNTAIDNGLRDARALMVVLTPGSVLSEQVRSEWNEALEQYLPVIPLHVQNCEVPRRLKVLNWVEFRGEYEIGLTTLGQILKNLNQSHLTDLRRRLHELKLVQQTAADPKPFQSKVTALELVIANWEKHMNEAQLPVKSSGTKIERLVTDSQPVPKYALEFRQQEVGLVMERWRAGDCCSLVGVASTGKTILLQHLSNPNVQGVYIKNVTGGKSFRAIIIDPHLLTTISPNASDATKTWAAYELMIHRLYLAAHPFSELPEEDVRVFYETYEAIQNKESSPALGVRYFELSLEIFFKNGVQIVFMFDAFEELLAKMPIQFFQSLRGIHDANSQKLQYMTISRITLPDAVERQRVPMKDIESFIELFTNSIIYIGPYNETDARNMLTELIRRNHLKYDQYVLDFVLWATGRYAGLISAGFRALETLDNLDANTIITNSDQLVNDLAIRRGVRTECKTIWTSLSEQERIMLRELASPRPNIDPNNRTIQQTFAGLQQKGLLKVQGSRVTIEPPVFYYFVMNNPDAEI